MSDFPADRLDHFHEVILSHDSAPQGFGAVEHPTHEAIAYNPFCGDRYHVRLLMSGGTIREIGFDGNGCAISRASASMMASWSTNRRTSELEKTRQRIVAALSSRDRQADLLDDLGDIGALIVTKRSPHRVRCALLVWDAACRSLGLDIDSTPGEIR
jgi:nitrogen fixation NifU-like protein